MKPKSLRPNIYQFFSWYHKESGVDLSAKYGDFVKTLSPRHNLDWIINTVCFALKIDVHECISASRERHVVDCRVIIVKVMHDMGFGDAAIGLHLGERERTTIRSIRKKFPDFHKYDQNFVEKYNTAKALMNTKIN